MSKRNLLCTTLAAWSLAGVVSMAAAQTAEPENQGIDEIVVTAEKSEESLQDTAAAVTAVTADTLVERGVVNLRDVQMVIPAARFQTEGNNTQVFLRGVGQNLDFPNMDPTVAFNFNGVYMPREATSAAFFDLERVEVLPGPQGTLYGRGAMGGTVNVQFQRPGFNNEGSALIEVGNYDLFHTTLAQNFAVSDTLALRAAIDYNQRDGYFTSGADSADSLAGRVSALYQPTNNFSAYLWAFGAENNGSTPNLVNHSDSGFLTGDAFDDVGASQIAQASAPFLPFTIGIARAEDMNYRVFAAGGEIDWELGENLTLTYVPGYTSLTSEPYYWLGALLFTNTADITMQSHEVRLSGETGAFEWLAGVYYYHQDYTGFYRIEFGGPANPNSNFLVGMDIRENILEGEGAFGQATWNVTDALRFTLGGRYSSDERQASGFDPRYDFGAFVLDHTNPLGSPTPTPWSYSNDYSHFDWKAAIEVDLAPDVMTYFSAQTGYAPGSYNFISATGLAGTDPFIGTPNDGQIEVSEAELLALAVGIKSRFFANTLQLNAEAFHYTYNDLVLQQFDSSLLFNPVFNADEVIIYGLQADLTWLPTPNDQVTVNVGYTHARNEEFVTPGGSDFSGLQPPYSPDWTVLTGYTHTFDLGHGTLDATLAARYESSWFAAFNHAPGTEQDASTKYDLSFTYDSGENWQFALWGRNLSDEEVLAAVGIGGVPGPATGYLEAPRTYGVRLVLNH